jgi:hypothetical protein
MRRTWAVVMTFAMIGNGCAARGSALSLAAQAVAAAPPRTEVQAASGTGARQDAMSPDLWRQYSARLPIGSTVRLRTTGGERLTAILLVVDDTGITVKPKTRVPEPARHVPFDRLGELELARGGSNLAKAAAIGGAVGGGVFLGLLMLLFASVD